MQPLQFRVRPVGQGGEWFLEAALCRCLSQAHIDLRRVPSLSATGVHGCPSRPLPQCWHTPFGSIPVFIHFCLFLSSSYILTHSLLNPSILVHLHASALLCTLTQIPCTILPCIPYIFAPPLHNTSVLPVAPSCQGRCTLLHEVMLGKQLHWSVHFWSIGPWTLLVVHIYPVFAALHNREDFPSPHIWQLCAWAFSNPPFTSIYVHWRAALI